VVYRVSCDAVQRSESCSTDCYRWAAPSSKHCITCEHTATAANGLSSRPTIICDAAVESDLRKAEETVSIGEAYKQLWEVVKLPAVRRFAVVLVTFR